MTIRKESFVEGEFYHIYNRGNSKQKIFLDQEDYDRFAKLLYLCNSTKSFKFRDDIVDQKIDAYDFDRGKPIVSIGAWALMSNHFHIYITPSHRPRLWENGENPIVIFMQKVCTAYSMYFNKKYNRTGKLFEGAFKSVHVKNDEQAKYNFSYIHLNPVKIIDPLWKENGIKNISQTLKFLSKYRWGSYLDYKNIKRQENKITSTKEFPDYFTNSKIFEEEIFDWLNYRSEF